MAESSEFELQKEEVQYVKERYSSECKVIGDVGDFKHIVTLKPKDVDVCIKFQLTEGYPSDAPHVITKSEVIPSDVMSEVNDAVSNIIKVNAGSPVMDKVIQEVYQLLKDKSLDCSPKLAKSCGKGKRKQKVRPIDSNISVLAEKKSSMKTAKDVINRIVWDKSLPIDSFTIGYLDRFRGIIEKPFSEFSWENIASVDFDVLAIPQHRIQYFKYQKVIVWDKKNRIDNIFGSTGSGLGIHDVIDHYEDFIRIQVEGDETSTDVGIGNDTCISPIQDTTTEGEKQARRDDEENVWKEKEKPTHFVCIRVTNPEIRAKVAHVQQAIIQKKATGSCYCVPPEILHGTLCTLQLTATDQIATACHVLRNLQTKLVNVDKCPTGVTFDGVECFFHRVIYAKMHPDENFATIVAHLTKMLDEAIPEAKVLSNFTRHMTLLKLSQEQQSRQKRESFDKEDYDLFDSFYFGKQDVEMLHLCEINNRRMEDGFYVTQASVSLNELLAN